MPEDFHRVPSLAGGALAKRRTAYWQLTVAAAGLWLALAAASRSVVFASVLLLAAAAFAGICALALRSLGVTRGHPLVQSLASRPWRDGRDVLRIATGHLSQLFIITPKGSYLAPKAVEVRMNPADLASLSELIDLDLARQLAAESYEAQISAFSARIYGGAPVDVDLIADQEVPAGRYALRQRRNLMTKLAAVTGARRGSYDELPLAPTKMTGHTTVASDADPPMIRLITGSVIAETQKSGARAGRSQAAELRLPDIPTISRLHARFSYSRGAWWIIGLGRNGVVLNGIPVDGQRPVHNGDMIRWGRNGDSPTSRVVIE